MERGDTFLITEPGSHLDTHLWVIASCPKKNPDHVLCLNLTAFDGLKEGVCILEKRDHPWIKKPTCVNYSQAKVLRYSQLLAWRDSKLISQKEPMESGVMARVYEGAERSKLMSLANAKILEDQGFIFGEPDPPAVHGE